MGHDRGCSFVVHRSNVVRAAVLSEGATECMSDTAAAARNYRRALRIYEKQLPAGHPYRVAAAKGLAELSRQ